MSRTERASLEEVLAERNRLWEELQRRTAQERELEYWRSRALELEQSVWWRGTEPLRKLGIVFREPRRAAAAIKRRISKVPDAFDAYPSLTYRDLGAALDFLANGFGLEPEVLGTDEQGAIRHAALRHGDGVILVQSDLPDHPHGSHAGQGWVYAAVADPDDHYRRAKAAGVEVLGDPQDAMDGLQRGYSARDLEGNLWSFGIHRPSRARTWSRPTRSLIRSRH